MTQIFYLTAVQYIKSHACMDTIFGGPVCVIASMAAKTCRTMMISNFQLEPITCTSLKSYLSASLCRTNFLHDSVCGVPACGLKL